MAWDRREPEEEHRGLPKGGAVREGDMKRGQVLKLLIHGTGASTSNRLRRLRCYDAVRHVRFVRSERRSMSKQVLYSGEQGFYIGVARDTVDIV